EIKGKYGTHSLVRCGGAPVNQASWVAFNQFMASYGSTNFTGASHLCSMPRVIAFNSVLGARPSPDYENTRCIIIWGSNPSESRSIAEGGVSYGNVIKVIPEALKRGSKLIVIDPRHIDLVDKADKWLRIEPGTDAALALALLHVIIKEELYDKDFVANWTTGFDDLASHVRQFTPDWAQSITRIPAIDIIETARIYAGNRPGTIRDGNFVDQSTNTVQTTRAMAMLSAITGNIDIPGGDCFYPRITAPFVNNRPTIKSLSSANYPIFPNVPFPSVVDAILTGKPYQPRAMIVYHGNPVLIDANSSRSKKALEQLDLLVVCDIFKTATAELAHIILPDCTDFETYGIKFRANKNGGYVSLHQKAIEPPGECRDICEVEYEIAGKMGLEKDYAWSNNEQCTNYILKDLNLTLNDLKKDKFRYISPPLQYQKYLKKGFKTSSGKIELYSDNFKNLGYSPLPVYIEPPDKLTGNNNYPMIGTGRRPGIYTHSRFRNIASLRRAEPEPLVRINPLDAESRGIQDWDIILVETSIGKEQFKAKVTDETMTGVVIIDFGWGNPWDQKGNVNALTTDEYRDTITGSTPNRRFRCQISKVQT
ncbi:MAG: molybdopterin-dependent oxidoreductase, partial [Chloroflexi bacterium]|nr:molybdopterin-dependent oxidoreductase [Chloroflexota bacterium]